MSTRPKRGWWYGREADATKYQAPIGGRGNKISIQEMVARMRAIADAKSALQRAIDSGHSDDM